MSKNFLEKTSVTKGNNLLVLKNYLDKMNFESLRKAEYVFGYMREIQSRKLMSRLNHSAKDSIIDILLISNIYNSTKWIIVSSQSDLFNPYIYDEIHLELTMTEFKRKKDYSFIFELKQLDNDNLLEIDKENFVLRLWKAPVLIRAQTYDDMDFRKEWNWGDLVYEGNNFGDTSNFYIIGSICNKV